MQLKKKKWKKVIFFSSCKNQELASFEKLLMEKLSSDIIHLALKCHLEIKHEDALFRKHQNNLFQGKKKPSCFWSHESQNSMKPMHIDKLD